MRPLFPLVVCALLQWQPTISCGGCGGPPPPPPARLPPYAGCSQGTCAEPTPRCGPVGMCTTSSPCSSDSDCPESPHPFGGATRKGACVRLVGVNDGAPFCTFYAESADDECVRGQDFHGTTAFTPVGSTSTEKKYACLPARFGCGDGECGLFSESFDRCPVDCVYRTCIPNGWEQPGSSCNRSDYSLCIDVGRPDGGPGDAGLGKDERLTGICVGSMQQTCGADGGCLSRGGFAGVCVSGLSFQQTCMQSCVTSADCLPDQRCVASPAPGISVCLPWGSRF